MGAYDDYAITLRNAFSREEFVKYFLGMDLNFASDEEIDRLIQSGALEGMASYPYYGYIKKTDQYLVVLLSE